MAQSEQILSALPRKPTDERTFPDRQLCATTGLLHRSESDQRSFGYMAAADTVTPTLQLCSWYVAQHGTNRGYVTGHAGLSVTPLR
jgi:hypothetical protein